AKEAAPSNQEADALVVTLTKDLKRASPEGRVKAADALAKLEEKGKAASRPLCEALLDVNQKVRLAAAAALEKVNPTIYPLVLPALVDDSWSNRQAAIAKIERLGLEGKPAVPILLYFKERVGKDQVADPSLLVHALAATAPDEKAITAKIAYWLVKD